MTRHDTTPTEIACTNCGRTTDERTAHCPGCGAADPWEESAAHEFDPDDLPHVFSVYHYDDHHGLWAAFCESYFGERSLTGDDIEGLPEEFPRMKYLSVDLYFAVTTDLDLEGPFLDEDRARAAVGTDD